MNNYYTSEKSILELIAILKHHKIKRAVVSPGSTNISFAASLLYDPDFEVYSAVDERSAAYMACGLAEESGEPVVISCTGATAARNYVPALTEAYYRKLPIVVVTSSQHFGRVGQHYPQVTDRSNPMNDIIKKSVQIPIPNSAEDKWANNVKMNDTILELFRHGGGPVHINIETEFSRIFDVKSLPYVRTIDRVFSAEKMPEIEAKRIIIFVGSHSKFSAELTAAVDTFCEKYNAVVVCDHTSNYKSNYRILGGIVERQVGNIEDCRKTDLLIHLGEVSGAYYIFEAADVWRVNPDGEIRDTFKKLSYVFEMSEIDFFNAYNQKASENLKNTYLEEWKQEERKLYSLLPELPFSNAWVAQQTAHLLPENSEIHFGILNSLRMWNLFELPKSVYGYSNVGGFGIDGCISSLLGASLLDSSKLYFGVIGDLATFYDLNSLGNRHIKSNVRIMVINNGTGFEMRHTNNRGDVFQEDADVLFAAGGHFGNKSRKVLKHFSEDLGFEYICADTKEAYLERLPMFADKNKREKPILFEVFVDVDEENESYNITRELVKDFSSSAKKAVKNLIGEANTKKIKTLLGR